eukprot:2634581-Ditylum_brightwellii.AAC.1
MGGRACNVSTRVVSCYCRVSYCYIRCASSSHRCQSGRYIMSGSQKQHWKELGWVQQSSKRRVLHQSLSEQVVSTGHFLGDTCRRVVLGHVSRESSWFGEVL